jgi:hypothetical protein
MSITASKGVAERLERELAVSKAEVARLTAKLELAT